VQKKLGYLQVPVPSEPFDLGAGVPVDDIAFIVLEAPGDDDEDVALANPDLLLDLSLDPAHPGDPVVTFHPDVIGAHHQFGDRKHFPVPLLGNSYPYDLFRGIIRFSFGQYINSFVSYLPSRLYNSGPSCKCLKFGARTL
jgi:hypothetical protein